MNQRELQLRSDRNGNPVYSQEDAQAAHVSRSGVDPGSLHFDPGKDPAGKPWRSPNRPLYGFRPQTQGHVRKGIKSFSDLLQRIREYDRDSRNSPRSFEGRGYDVHYFR